MPALTVELTPLVDPSVNIGNYLAMNTVLVPVQTSEQDRNRTYNLDLGALYRNILDYVDIIAHRSADDDHQAIWADAEVYSLPSCTEPTVEVVQNGGHLHFVFGIPKCCCCLKNIEDCDIEIRWPGLRNIEDCDINI